MYEYFLMGKVYKENYLVSNYPTKINFPKNNYNWLDERWSPFYFNIKDTDSNIILIKTIPINYIYRSSDKYKDKEDYINKNRIVTELYFITSNEFDKYEEFDSIKCDREFRDNEEIKIDDKNYSIKYRYNKNLKRHELCLDDYIVRTEVDKDLKKACEEKFSDFKRRIEEYNKQVRESDVVIDERFKCYQPETDESSKIGKNKSLLTRIKKWFGRC